MLVLEFQSRQIFRLVNNIKLIRNKFFAHTNQDKNYINTNFEIIKSAFVSTQLLSMYIYKMILL